MKYIILVIFFIFSFSATAQNENLERISTYYSSVDKDRIIDISMKYFNDINIDVWKEYGGSTPESIMEKTRHNWEQMRSDSSIVMITLMMKNIKHYSFDKSIYDFLEIDTLDVEVVCYDAKRNDLSRVRSDNCFFGCELSKTEIQSYKKILDILKNTKPDAWLGEGRIFSSDKSGRFENLLFLKDSKIFVICTRNGHVYELNRFVHKFFRQKKFKKLAAFDRMCRIQRIVLVGDKLNLDNWDLDKYLE